MFKGEKKTVFFSALLHVKYREKRVAMNMLINHAQSTKLSQQLEVKLKFINFSGASKQQQRINKHPFE